MSGPSVRFPGWTNLQNNSLFLSAFCFCQFQFLLRGGVFEGPGVSRFPHFLCSWKRPIYLCVGTDGFTFGVRAFLKLRADQRPWYPLRVLCLTYLSSIGGKNKSSANCWVSLDDVMVQQIMRHQDVGVTRKHYITVPEQSVSAMAKLEAALCG